MRACVFDSRSSYFIAKKIKSGVAAFFLRETSALDICARETYKKSKMETGETMKERCLVDFRRPRVYGSESGRAAGVVAVFDRRA